jgi:hypothetical protein
MSAMAEIVNYCLMCGSPAVGATELCTAHTPDGLDDRPVALPLRWLTLAQAAHESGLNIRTIRRLVRSGRLRAQKQGRGWVVTPDALRACLASHRFPPQAARARPRAWRR